MAVQRGILTPQSIPQSGRTFAVADSPPACYRDRWGEWLCGHDHEASLPLEEAYQYTEGWTAQSQM